MISPTLSAFIITLSDRASQGIYEDQSGSELEKMLGSYMSDKNLACCIQRKIIPDEASLLNEVFQEALVNEIDFIFTAGGTGIGSRDIAPDVSPLFVAIFFR
jgi:molybdopterin adenylyltransferase